ncbi:adenosine deaminase family protein [Novosphingobium album (ex Liu et al. 2023)]|uniref:adenosine deaminase n=1 Tax=Novosphingobium album (ex Liu et al. 2023) TaxID=3031130 RepID=A0ABT5WJS1_9SPHN|nr:adenosine deaminase [Novosphingobium album (ex Liu et al. 2023)]MDE8650289.1 adenosine deaminase [Novosphingobium album (ex Liu et al. 2023)]
MKRALLAGLAAFAAFCASAAHADAASEAAASAVFDDLASNPARLRVFLQAMPKGGDLHNHLGGTPYAEDYLEVAARAGLCVDDTGLLLVAPPCPAERTVKALGERRPFAFARLIDSLSTRGVQHGVGANEASGHTQFFSSFDRFGPVYAADVGQWMAVARRGAARDKVSYLELMHNPRALVEYALSASDEPLDEAGLAPFYARESGTLGPLLDRAVTELDRDEAAAAATLACGTGKADPACGVAVHYLTFAWRGVPPRQAFRSLIAGFALARKDKRFVGINIVQPEDDPIALRDYDLHMAMFRFLEAKYPDVPVTMHAGELTLGLVRPQDLRDHIARAVASGARRIGHGTDIAFEDDAIATMTRMARERIAVEVNLSSAAVILGIKGGDHPLRLYRSMGVPMVLSTDDMGVLRSDMTNEYQRAASEQGLRYPDLKALARASLEYAFVPGASLWRDGRTGIPAPDAAALVKTSEKARLQADLEARFDRFEQSVGQFPRGAMP